MTEFIIARDPNKNEIVEINESFPVTSKPFSAAAMDEGSNSPSVRGRGDSVRCARGVWANA